MEIIHEMDLNQRGQLRKMTIPQHQREKGSNLLFELWDSFNL